MRGLLVALCIAATGALCPFTGHDASAQMPEHHPLVPQAHVRFAAALRALDFKAVKQDLLELMTDSQDAWPADYGTYGPFFIRLAWHCSGSYRTSDGRGGCDGGRQRFDPERSWEDNTNLDKARGLLWPIKAKYGLGLSWGDLFILAGTTAIESMGGPVLGFCAGRVDDADGSWSAELGPSAVQEDVAPCPVNGECEKPLGSTTIGLIYLNPEGPMAQPIPELSAGEVRDTFARMAMNDSETVALIGGGHAFGKTHGACAAGVGPSPHDAPEDPWRGLCGSGVGADAWTSGFEGPWTTAPTTWDNTYFTNLLAWTWEVHVGPGGKHQWRVNGTSPLAPAPDGNGTQPIMMMTSDVSLTKDPTGAYQRIVRAYADDAALFDEQFRHAWYKLVTRDMGPVTRCVGPFVPAAQPFQYPLPDAPSELANFSDVRAMVEKALVSPVGAIPADVGPDGEPSYGALFVRLAFQCASTFRVSDYQGGCNGARVRFAPLADWSVNAGLDDALSLLAPVKDEFGTSLSWADLIVLAGGVALEHAGARPMRFCGGRTDASDGSGAEFLSPAVTGNASGSAAELKASIKLMGLSNREMVALFGSALGRQGAAYAMSTGFAGTLAPAALSNAYYTTMLSESWEEVDVGAGHVQYQAAGKQVFAMRNDVLLRYDAELMAIAQDFGSDNDVFLEEFSAAWTKLMNIDRFDGPTGNACA